MLTAKRLAAISSFFVFLPLAFGVTVTEWDFRSGTHDWQANERVLALHSTAEGLIVESVGHDPWIEGPAVDIPADHLVRVTLRMRSQADRLAQLFYGPQFVAGRQSAFAVDTDGQWHEYRVMISEPLGPGTRFRLDPCNNEGKVTVQSIRVEAIRRPEAPDFTGAEPIVLDEGSLSLDAGRLRIRHAPDAWGGFTVRVQGRPLATGYQGEMIAIDHDEDTEWLALKEARVTCEARDTGLSVKAILQDRSGAEWRLTRRFRSVPGLSVVEVTSAVQVNRDRNALLLPWLTLLPGFQTFGASKHQGLFAGLEYLADEPSSSLADITGPAHLRRIPDPLKITFPLMALEQNGLGLGLIWERSELVAAGFDSPDRVFGSQAHAFWLSGPAVGERRFAHDLVAHSPLSLEANEPLTVKAWIVGALGPSVVPVIEQYVRLKGWPELPTFTGGFQRAVTLLAQGWLDSGLNEDWRFRHAVWGNSFGPGPAADAAAFMSLLANDSDDIPLSRRLRQGARNVLETLPASDAYASAVSHVRPPLAPLLFGRVDAYVHGRLALAKSQLKQFDPEGRLIYRPTEEKPDYGKTHFTNHANGLGGGLLADILFAATLAGDPDLRQRALTLLDHQTQLYANTVPRGAQTWEVPLHTPDILAAAHMVDAYVYGYLLSDNEPYLDQARYWAWTGVPFVYLQNPTNNAVGPYATIAVLGATHWEAPVWFGLPVQWCGLVYASALHHLADVDPDSPWRDLARGITLTGLQMTWPETDPERQGLLPDLYHLREQSGGGPAINPGTVGAHLPEAFGRPPLYTLRRLKRFGGILHAPVPVTDLHDQTDSIEFALRGMDRDRFSVLISGLEHRPTRIEHRASPDDRWHPLAEADYDDAGFLVLSCRASFFIRLTNSSNKGF